MRSTFRPGRLRRGLRSTRHGWRPTWTRWRQLFSVLVFVCGRHVLHAQTRTQTTADFLTVTSAGARLLADIQPTALDIDFQVEGAATERITGGSLSRTVDISGKSGLLRWRRVGDSLALVEHVGWEHGALHYVRRGVFPLLPTSPAAANGTFRIDVSALFGLVADTPSVVTAMRYIPTGQEPRLVAWQTSSVRTTVEPTATDLQLVHDAQGRRTYHVESHWRVIPLVLPARPMRPRRYDPRLGYWNLALRPGEGDGNIYRWRLERRDPTAAVSDVVEPVVYHIDSTVPARWLPWITRAVTMWTPAFDSIGLRHALVVRTGATEVTNAAATASPPGVRALPPRECLITWSTEFFDGAVTEIDTSDPRTGEILHCTMRLNAGTISMIQRTAFLYTAATDSRVRFPFADSVTGPLLTLAVAHEMGHSLGFDENHLAGAAYPTDSLRSTSFLRRWGLTASIMSYAWYNAIARPEDGLTPAELYARLGVLDRWAIRWGYAPLPDTLSAEGEAVVLEQWRSAQDTARYLRAGEWRSAAGRDPADQYYTLGADRVASVDAIARNLARAVTLLDGSDTAVADPVRVGAVRTWTAALESAAGLVGGVMLTPPYRHAVGQTPSQPYASDQQVQAFRLVLRHLFYGQDPLVRSVLLRGPVPLPAVPPAESISDTSLVLFETLPAAWATTTAEWRNAQRAVLSAWGQADVLEHLRTQSVTTHVLPVVCADVTALGRALQARQVRETDPAVLQHVTVLRTLLRRFLDPDAGACRQHLAPG